MVAHRVKRLLALWETRFDPRFGKIPWGRKWQPIPVFLPGKFHEQSLAVAVHGVTRVGHDLATKPLLMDLEDKIRI